MYLTLVSFASLCMPHLHDEFVRTNIPSIQASIVGFRYLHYRSSHLSVWHLPVSVFFLHPIHFLTKNCIIWLIHGFSISFTSSVVRKVTSMLAMCNYKIIIIINTNQRLHCYQRFLSTAVVRRRIVSKNESLCQASMYNSVKNTCITRVIVLVQKSVFFTSNSKML